MRPDLKLIEPRFKESIDRFVNDGVPTGDFLQAVLSNDLVNSIGRADMEALENLPHIVCYIYNEIPSPCWGSKDKVKNWKGLNQTAN